MSVPTDGGVGRLPAWRIGRSQGTTATASKDAANDPTCLRNFPLGCPMEAVPNPKVMTARKGSASNVKNPRSDAAGRTDRTPRNGLLSTSPPLGMMIR